MKVGTAMGLKWQSILTCSAIVGATTVYTAHFQAEAAQTIYNTPKPSIIRIAIRQLNVSGEPDPRGPISWVQTVPFDQYCEDVLPNEWVPGWNQESLRAGAMAIKMFAWYHHLHPVTIDGFTFDVDNTVNFQHYRYLSRLPITNQAYQTVMTNAYAMPNGEIIELNYRAGTKDDPNWQYRNAQKMAQWGSQYWALQGRTYLQILQFYYSGRALLKP
jgi:peptidoglycan hydrolase-like amidase